MTSPGPASFSCSARGLPRPNITWVGHNSTLLTSGVNGVSITETEEGDRELVSILRITTTVPSVAGEYRCLADNGVSGRGDINETSAVLTVYGEYTMMHVVYKI